MAGFTPSLPFRPNFSANKPNPQNFAFKSDQNTGFGSFSGFTAPNQSSKPNFNFNKPKPDQETGPQSFKPNFRSSGFDQRSNKAKFNEEKPAVQFQKPNLGFGQRNDHQGQKFYQARPNEGKPSGQFQKPNDRVKSNKTFQPSREEYKEDLDEQERVLRMKAIETYNSIKNSKQMVPNPKARGYSPIVASSESSFKKPREPKMRSWPEEKNESSEFKNKEFKEITYSKELSNIAYKPIQKPEKVPERATERFSGRMTEKRSERSTEKLSERSTEKLSERSTEKAKQIYGSIIMCSEEECISRQESNQLSIFEKYPGTNKYNPSWTAKKYLRSNPDREEYLRTEKDLSGTLKYLIHEILDVDTNGNPNEYETQEGHGEHSFQDIYPFLFDRMRAIIKDWKMLKSVESDEFIEDHEYIARFLILSFVEGVEIDTFNLNLNHKLLEDVLNTLVRAYEKRRAKNLPCSNQAEFICYYIITKPDNMLQILSLLKDLPQDLRDARYIQLAIYIFKTYHNDDYEELFNTVYTSPYLFACAGYSLFHRIRIHILQLLYQFSNREMSLDLFQQTLGFSDIEEAKLYINEFEIGFKENRDPSKSCVYINEVPEKFISVPFSVVPVGIKSLCLKPSRLEVVINPEEISEAEESNELEKTEKKELEEFEEEKVEVVKIEEPAPKIQPPEREKVEEKKQVFLIEEKKEEFKTVPSVFKIEAVKEKEEVKVEKKNVEKKIEFKFPFDDKDFFKIIRDKNDKIKIKENIRNYRNEMKLKEKAKKRQQEVLTKLKVIQGWKSVTLQNKLDDYIEKRKVREMEFFREQFSSLIICDTICQQRYLYLNDTKIK